jgi:hypothetical protein
MPRRRLEDRIRDLCSQASEPNWRIVLAELRLSIHEHALKMSNLAMAAVVSGQPQIIRERRERRAMPEFSMHRDPRKRSDALANTAEWNPNHFDSEAYEASAAGD